MSFGELCVLVIVAVVIIGPKDLPRVLRRAGQYAGKLRRMASDVRKESGIDEMLQSEGLTKDIAEIRRLAQGDFMSPVVRERPALELTATGLLVVRDREYPREGADSHSAIPDTAHMYAQNLPKSPYAMDPLYVLGETSAVLPALSPSPEPASSAPAGTPALAPPSSAGHA